MTSVAIERRRRMAEVWRASEPCAQDIALARQRFVLARRQTPRLELGLLLRWGVVGAAAGVATMLLLGRVSQSPAAIEAERRALAPPEPAPTLQAPAKPAATPAPRNPATRERPAPRRVRPHAAALPLPAPPASSAAAPEVEAPRDTEALKRAERWISIGRGAEAMPILVGLEKDGSTPEVKQQARKLRQTAPKPK